MLGILKVTYRGILTVFNQAAPGPQGGTLSSCGSLISTL